MTQQIMETQEETIHLSCSETAKLVRNALKEKFPSQKFSVRSSTYSMGASIDVSWEDGVASDEVNKVIKQFEGAGFDGMIDYKYYVNHWLLPNGRVKLAKKESTTHSERYELAKPHPDAKKVSFGSDYVFGKRTISSEMFEKIAKQIAKLRKVEFVSMSSYPELFGEAIDNWYHIVHCLTHSVDLTNFKKVVDSGVTCGSFEDFFVLTSSDKFYLKCSKCNRLLPANKIFSYVDGNNIAITKNSSELCKPCYIENYGGFN